MKTLLFLVLLFVAAIGIDVAWFSLYASPFYIDAIGALLRQTSNGFTPDIIAATSVYVLLILGIVWFVLPRAYSRITRGAFWGGAYGFIVYGIYDVTNYATLAHWPLFICLIDVAWGIVFCAVLSALAVLLQNKLAL